MKKAGFTLVEVLLTVGVIGIVAAITIPVLMNKISLLENESLFKKIYNEFDTRVAMLKQEDKFPTSYIDDEFYNLFSPDKVCTNNSSTNGCWHKANEWFNLCGVGMAARNSSGMIMKNGVLVNDCCSGGTNNKYHSVSGSGDLGYSTAFYVDVNGFKKPNKIGEDIYMIEVYQEIVMPEGALNTRYPGYACDRSCVSTDWWAGTQCTYGVINKEN